MTAHKFRVIAVNWTAGLILGPILSYIVIW